MKRYFTVHFFYHLPDGKIGFMPIYQHVRTTAADALALMQDAYFNDPTGYPIAGVQMYQQRRPGGYVKQFFGVGVKSFDVAL